MPDPAMEPAGEAVPDELDVSADNLIASMDGDARAAVKALLVANAFLEHELDMTRPAVSFGFSRGWHAKRGSNDAG